MRVQPSPRSPHPCPCCPPLPPHTHTRYHLLHPDYILKRLKELGHAFRLLLLVHVDVEDMVRPLGDISRAAVLNDATLVCAWSNEVRSPGG